MSIRSRAWQCAESSRKPPMLVATQPALDGALPARAQRRRTAPRPRRPHADGLAQLANDAPPCVRAGPQGATSPLITSPRRGEGLHSGDARRRRSTPESPPRANPPPLTPALSCAGRGRTSSAPGRNTNGKPSSMSAAPALINVMVRSRAPRAGCEASNARPGRDRASSEVSLKGPANFVAPADTARRGDPARRPRQGAAGLRLPRRGRRRARGRRQDPHLDRRSARRHLPTSCTAFRISRSRSALAARGIDHRRRDLQSRQ